MIKLLALLLTMLVPLQAAKNGMMTRSMHTSADMDAYESSASSESEEDVPSIFTAVPWCLEINEPLYLEAKQYMLPRKLQKLIKFLQNHDLSSTSWAPCLYAEAVDQENVNALSYITAFEVAQDSFDYDFSAEFMEWCCKNSQWNYLRHFIFKKNFCRIPLNGNLILLFRGIPQDQPEAMIIALENDTYSKEEISYAFELAVQHKSKKVLETILRTDLLEAGLKNQILFAFFMESDTAFHGLLNAGISFWHFNSDLLVFLLQSAAIAGFEQLTSAILEGRNDLTAYLNHDECQKPWILAEDRGHLNILEINRRHGFEAFTLTEALQQQNYDLAHRLIRDNQIDMVRICHEVFKCLDRNDLFGLEFLLQNYVPVMVMRNGLTLLSTAIMMNDFEAVRLLLVRYNSCLQVTMLPITPEMMEYLDGLLFELKFRNQSRK